MGLLDSLRGAKKSDSELVQEKLRRQAMINELAGEEAKLEVMDIFDIKGVGVIIVGEVISGVVKNRSKANVNGKMYTVGSIEMKHKRYDEALKGEKVGIRLENISKGDVKRGDICNFQ